MYDFQASFGQTIARFEVLGISAPGPRKVIVQFGSQFTNAVRFDVVE